MQYTPDSLRLYCLMRNDLASLNAGKAMAQAMHAQAHANMLLDNWHTYSATADWSEMWKEWKAHTKQGFGSTIVLGGGIGKIRSAIETFGMMSWPCGIIHDPTYPLMDGDKTLHLIPLDTCAWVFGPAQPIQYVTRDMGLHP